MKFYKSEVKGLGYKVVPVDINHAKKTWTCVGKKMLEAWCPKELLLVAQGNKNINNEISETLKRKD